MSRSGRMKRRWSQEELPRHRATDPVPGPHHPSTLLPVGKVFAAGRAPAMYRDQPGDVCA
jgi:hypothetical protein